MRPESGHPHGHTGSLTILLRLCLLRDTATSMRILLQQLAYPEGVGGQCPSATSGASHQPGNSWGISQCSLQSLDGRRGKAVLGAGGENSRRQTLPNAGVPSAAAARSSALAPGGVGSMLWRCTNSGSSNICAVSGAPLMAGWLHLQRLCGMAGWQHQTVSALRF